MGRSPGSGERWRAGLVAVAAVGLVVWPIARPRADDSFPLSNYPMFTADKPRQMTFFQAVGVAADGGQASLSAELVGGTVEVVQAARAMSTADRNGTLDALCRDIAGRTADARPEVVEVRIARQRYDVVDALRADHPRPLASTVVATCPA